MFGPSVRGPSSCLTRPASFAAQVSEAGEVLYVFARNFKEAIRGRSLLLRLEPAVATAAAALGYLGRVAFGTALIVSVVCVSDGSGLAKACWAWLPDLCLRAPPGR